jgi:hypothetical protein
LLVIIFSQRADPERKTLRIGKFEGVVKSKNKTKKPKRSITRTAGKKG